MAGPAVIAALLGRAGAAGAAIRGAPAAAAGAAGALGRGAEAAAGATFRGAAGAANAAGAGMAAAGALGKRAETGYVNAINNHGGKIAAAAGGAALVGSGVAGGLVDAAGAAMGGETEMSPDQVRAEAMGQLGIQDLGDRMVWQLDPNKLSEPMLQHLSQYADNITMDDGSGAVLVEFSTDGEFDEVGVPRSIYRTLARLEENQTSELFGAVVPGGQ